MSEQTPSRRRPVPAGSRRGVFRVLGRLVAGGVALALVWLGGTAAVILGEVRARRAPAPADAIVVLGAAAYGKKPSPVLRERLRHAVELYQEGVAPVLVFTGGKRSSTDLTEAEVARRWAVAAGADPAGMVVEARSRSTRENLANTRTLLGEKGMRKVVLVSDPLHLARARLLGEREGLEVQTSPTPTTRFRSLRTKLPFLLRECGFYWSALLGFSR